MEKGEGKQLSDSAEHELDMIKLAPLRTISNLYALFQLIQHAALPCNLPKTSAHFRRVMKELRKESTKKNRNAPRQLLVCEMIQ